MSIPETLTVPEAMAKLHCSKSFLYALIREGKLRSYTIGSKRLIDAESLARLPAGLAFFVSRPVPAPHPRVSSVVAAATQPRHSIIPADALSRHAGILQLRSSRRRAAPTPSSP